jgi:hypothetical protein
MEHQQNKPASIADIAFETGVIAERERIIKLIEKNLLQTALLKEVLKTSAILSRLENK